MANQAFRCGGNVIEADAKANAVDNLKGLLSSFCLQVYLSFKLQASNLGHFTLLAYFELILSSIAWPLGFEKSSGEI
jgi:hypothetical protein